MLSSENRKQHRPIGLQLDAFVNLTRIKIIVENTNIKKLQIFCLREIAIGPTQYCHKFVRILNTFVAHTIVPAVSAHILTVHARFSASSE